MSDTHRKRLTTMCVTLLTGHAWPAQDTHWPAWRSAVNRLLRQKMKVQLNTNLRNPHKKDVPPHTQNDASKRLLYRQNCCGVYAATNEWWKNCVMVLHVDEKYAFILAFDSGGWHNPPAFDCGWGILRMEHSFIGCNILTAVLLGLDEYLILEGDVLA